MPVGAQLRAGRLLTRKTSRPAWSSDWALPIEPAAFLDAFRSWPGGPLPGADELVADVRARVPVGCLSNTNAVHWDRHFARWPILDAFDYRFLSFELGLVKPDRELFDRVARAAARAARTRPVPRRQRAQRRRRRGRGIQRGAGTRHRGSVAALVAAEVLDA